MGDGNVKIYRRLSQNYGPKAVDSIRSNDEAVQKAAFFVLAKYLDVYKVGEVTLKVSRDRNGEFLYKSVKSQI